MQPRQRAETSRPVRPSFLIFMTTCSTADPGCRPAPYMGERTPAARVALAAPALPAHHEGQLLEEAHILLVLEERPMQRRDQLAWIALAQLVRADILGNEEL